MNVHKILTGRVRNLLESMPLEVKFAGGWKRIAFGSAERFRDRNTVTLYGDGGEMVARMYPDSEVRYRLLKAESGVAQVRNLR